jgi:hypothetical protein
MRQLHYHSRPMNRHAFSAVLLAAALASACGASDPVESPMVTPSLTLSRPSVALGSPIDMTYKFVVAADAKFTQDYHVMVHFGDRDQQLLYTDDHEPPTPTSTWKPGQTIEYTRTFFAPVYPYVGDATIEIGMYATGEKLRVPMVGTDAGHRSYRIAQLTLQPQTDGIQTIYQDGWWGAEGATANGTGWHWTKSHATFAVKNPKKDCIFYLDVDNPSTLLGMPQQVTVTSGSGAMLDQFTVTASHQIMRKIAVSAAAWGTADNAELKIAIDKTFVPKALDPKSQDPRELGIRVMHAAVVPAP